MHITHADLSHLATGWFLSQTNAYFPCCQCTVLVQHGKKELCYNKYVAGADVVRQLHQQWE
jgi:hypothetical protein